MINLESLCIAEGKVSVIQVVHSKQSQTDMFCFRALTLYPISMPSLTKNMIQIKKGWKVAILGTLPYSAFFLQTCLCIACVIKANPFNT